MQAAVRLIDILVRKSQRLYELSDDSECILRIQLKHTSHTVTIGEEGIVKGELVLAIHVWNERIPKIPIVGADLKWALHVKRQLVHSFRLLAKELQNENRYANVRAVCGVSALISNSDHIGGMRMMQHLGFTVLPCYRPLGRFGEFWENLFSWWLIWTFNKASLKSREFWRIQRTEIWITSADFIRRYG
jgi:hypothetical protein